MNPDRALLGAVLSGYADIDALAEIIRPSDFREPHDELVWSAILRTRETGTKVDPMTVRVALDSDAKIPGGPVYLVELAQQCPHVSSAATYARQVADEAAARRLSGAAMALDDLARSSGRSAADLAERARTIVDRATDQVTTVAGVSLGDVMPEVLDIAEHGRTAALSTGWPDLDRIVDGIAPSRLIVVGARPGVGKSLMGTNLAVHTAHTHKHAVLMASMEMPRDEVGQRILAHHAGVSLTSLMNGSVDPQAWERIARNTTDLMDLPITIEDAAGQTVGSIRNAIRNLKRRRDDVALVVVDYLQLMQVRDARMNRAEAIGEISRGLKLLAREFNTCVVALCQVNRQSTHRAEGRPTMADLRESGSIEADADSVILLHQPDDEDPEIEVIVDKNRAGPKGVCRLQVQGHYARIASVKFNPTRGIA